MSFQSTTDMAAPATPSEAASRIAVALSLFVWIAVVAMLFWR